MTFCLSSCSQCSPTACICLSVLISDTLYQFSPLLSPPTAVFGSLNISVSKKSSLLRLSLSTHHTLSRSKSLDSDLLLFCFSVETLLLSISEHCTEKLNVKELKVKVHQKTEDMKSRKFGGRIWGCGYTIVVLPPQMRR